MKDINSPDVSEVLPQATTYWSKVSKRVSSFIVGPRSMYASSISGVDNPFEYSNYLSQKKPNKKNSSPDDDMECEETKVVILRKPVQTKKDEKGSFTKEEERSLPRASTATFGQNDIDNDTKCPPAEFESSVSTLSKKGIESQERTMRNTRSSLELHTVVGSSPNLSGLAGTKSGKVRPKSEVTPVPALNKSRGSY
ncbi:hypothetical protein BP5796_12445 [Coleophoma crateriformis]|uniref:Uncharacterized protein n=1 Tax=Coleophoma crateriformis TaxID=565419 RepID=A0A3D8Q9J6_9HELO|nr:hypothetical protein BP5796_12445 [Coleophoma crateriformis]